MQWLQVSSIQDTTNLKRCAISGNVLVLNASDDESESNTLCAAANGKVIHFHHHDVRVGYVNNGELRENTPEGILRLKRGDDL